MKFIISNINYGGRVTDTNDHKVLNALVSDFVNTSIFNENYQFSNNPNYQLSELNLLSDVFKFIDKLPAVDDPDLFGLNKNSNIIL